MRILPCLIAAASLGLPAFAAAAEFDFPPRKAGQWQIEMTPESSPAMTMDICLDEATDKQMMQAGMSISDGMCSDIDVSQAGGAITIDATCTMGAMKTVSHTVMTGDFQTAYDVTITSTIEAALRGCRPTRPSFNMRGGWEPAPAVLRPAT